MNNKTPFPLPRLAGAALLSIALVTGCNKKQEEVPSPPPSITTESQPQPGTPTPASPRQLPAETRVTEMQQAVKNKDYDRALDALLARPQSSSPTTPEQAAQINAAMTALESQLAAAAAAGDAKAIAARERLRQRSLQLP